jgi:uncharacterized repeat protein (TIGR01451 family)
LLAGVGGLGAQTQSFRLTLTNTPSPILLGSNIAYHLSVSNATGFNLNPGVITSDYSSNAEFLRATNQFGFTNLVGRVDFAIPANSFPAGGVIEVLLELRGTNVGLVTNTFTVTIYDQAQTTPASTNVVSSIIVPPEADLGITLIGPPEGVFPGDTFSYRLVATNAGPDAAIEVVVSNRFPANASLVGMSPSGQVQLSDGVVWFSVGTLTNRQSATAIITASATNAVTTNLIWASISAPMVTDTNPINNAVTSNVPILAPVLGQVIVTNLSSQQFNPQTGWMEQRVVLENVSTSRVDSLRLLVGGLTNRLVNATGTNGAVPYVAHGAGLDPSEQVELVLEYANPGRTNGANPSLTAYGTPQLDLTPGNGSSVTVDRIAAINHPTVTINNGRMLLEWPVTAGAAYQVVYDESADFRTARGSLPAVTAPPGANRAQWLDYGPPRTLSSPSNAAMRLYKVIRLP